MYNYPSACPKDDNRDVKIVGFSSLRVSPTIKNREQYDMRKINDMT